MSDKKLMVYGAILVSGLVLVWLVKLLQPSDQVSQTNIKRTTPSRTQAFIPSVGENQVVFGDLVMDVPLGWKVEQPSTSLRIGQFRLPGSPVGKASGELAVFSNIGGSIQANLDRWFNQFQQPDGILSKNRATIDQKSVNGITITLADVSGTFIGSGIPVSQRVNNPNYRLLAAIVQIPQNTYYFKLVGPIETITHWYESFNNFVDSIQKLNDV